MKSTMGRGSLLKYIREYFEKRRLSSISIIFMFCHFFFFFLLNSFSSLATSQFTKGCVRGVSELVIQNLECIFLQK